MKIFLDIEAMRAIALSNIKHFAATAALALALAMPMIVVAGPRMWHDGECPGSGGMRCRPPR